MIELCCEYSQHSGFTLKRVRDMIKTYSQMHRTDSTHNTAQSFGQLG